MALKYFIEYKDIVDIQHRVEIFDDNFIGTATQVGGRAYLDFGEVDLPLEAIRGQGLKIELEANTGLTFNDLWTEEEKVINVQYIRDGIILFNGWLNPEGFYEDYVSTDWIISLDCVDGLSYLKDLSFVDENGFSISGRKKYIELLAIALKRTGLDLNINIDIQIRYNGLSDTLDPLDNVYANTARYIEEDQNTITDCEKVIRDILEPFSACLTLYNNEWYIYKPNQLFEDQTANFYTYNASGASIGSKTLDTTLSLGSEINGFFPHHCNTNQQITNKSSLGAYRVNYKYGLVQSLLNNINLFSDDGITIDDFLIYTPNSLEPLVVGGSGITINKPGSRVEQIRTSQNIVISRSSSFKVNMNVSITSSSSDVSGIFIFQALLSDSLNPDLPFESKINYSGFLTDEAGVSGWNSIVDGISGGIVIDNGNKNSNIDFVTEIPNSLDVIGTDIPGTTANLFIKLYAPIGSGNIQVTVNTLRIEPVSESQEQQNIIGEFHTVERLNKPSAKVDEVKEVLTGDKTSNFYEGTIYKSDSITPTSTWSRKSKGETKELLQIMVEDTARIQQATAREFSGDIFGYFPYLSTVSINGLTGLFIPIKYEYDTLQNIISATFRQIFSDEVADLEYKKTFDFGNTVKPTIKG